MLWQCYGKFLIDQMKDGEIFTDRKFSSLFSSFEIKIRSFEKVFSFTPNQPEQNKIEI